MQFCLKYQVSEFYKKIGRGFKISDPLALNLPYMYGRLFRLVTIIFIWTLFVPVYKNCMCLSEALVEPTYSGLTFFSHAFLAPRLLEVLLFTNTGTRVTYRLSMVMYGNSDRTGLRLNHRLPPPPLVMAIRFL